MLTMTNLPPEVYLVALDLMGQDRPADPADARDALLSAENRCDYEPVHVTQGQSLHNTVSAFGAAVALYLSLSGPFDEGDGEFAGLGGYIL